jgi:Rhs element Vgr protein
VSIAVATITSEEKALDPAIGVISIEVRKELDRIPEARLVLLDGSVAEREFAVSNSAFFEPGKRIRIDMRYEGEEDAQIFEGLVVRHGVEAGTDGSELHVELKDEALVLSRERKSVVHREQSDSDVISTLISDAELTAGTIDATEVQHEELIQYYASDWDFLLARADVNGQVVIVDDGTISVRAMAADEAAKARFEFGLDEIYELELELDGSGQWSKITSRAWDLAQQALAEPVEAAQVSVAAGNVDASALAGKLGGDELTLMVPAALPADELAPWASARLARSRLSLLRGRLVVAGRADLKPFDRIELGGVGDRFNGTLLVAGVIHRFDHEGWQTELQLGLSPDWFARTPDIADVPAGGLLPPATSLQIGVVDAFEADPDGEQRIKVKLPGLFGEEGAVWARMARPDAGAERGFVFWPELDDEVVVGFLAGDPRQAIVLGALHGSAKPPPAAVGEPSDANPKRAIVSRSGAIIAFDDDKKSITVETPGKNKILIDDDAKAITIADQHGNTITMDDKGITLKSASDFMIDAAGKVTIKGSATDVQ